MDDMENLKPEVLPGSPSQSSGSTDPVANSSCTTHSQSYLSSSPLPKIFLCNSSTTTLDVELSTIQSRSSTPTSSDGDSSLYDEPAPSIASAISSASPSRRPSPSPESKSFGDTLEAPPVLHLGREPRRSHSEAPTVSQHPQTEALTEPPHINDDISPTTHQECPTNNGHLGDISELQTSCEVTPNTTESETTQNSPTAPTADTTDEDDEEIELVIRSPALEEDRLSARLTGESSTLVSSGPDAPTPASQELPEEKIAEQEERERVATELQEEKDLTKAVNQSLKAEKKNKARQEKERKRQEKEEMKRKEMEMYAIAQSKEENRDPEFPPGVNPFGKKSSAAETEWQRLTSREVKNETIDKMMKLTGLEKVKQLFLDIRSRAEICKSQGSNLKKERFNIVFRGNPGTGKTTVARLYAELLHSVGMLSGKAVIETSGAKLAYEGPSALQDKLENILKPQSSNGSSRTARMNPWTLRNLSSSSSSDSSDSSSSSDSSDSSDDEDEAVEEGGVLFVDEAYQLTAPHSSSQGRQTLDLILTEMENNIGKLVVIFVGYNKDMESFFEHNPGLSSRIPYTLDFDDFDNSELWEIFNNGFKVRYDLDKITMEGGFNGKAARVAVRRLGRVRGVKGFGNARTVDNLISKIAERQAQRLTEEQREGNNPNIMHFTQLDVIGPRPEKVFKHAAWTELEELVGLEKVKQETENMIEMIQTNYDRELVEIPPLELTLNRVFCGSPGTGKTTVAKLYARIMADLGLLSKGEVVVKQPADFIGSCLGKSEAQTRAILESTVGKVLIIDEAYGLSTTGLDSSGGHYRKAVQDTLVSEIQGIPGDDRCVLLLGYEDEIMNMFQDGNEGLSRRFAIDTPFRFENYDLPQLESILKKKMKSQGVTADDDAMDVALQSLDRARIRPNFSNAAEIDLLLDKAKRNYQQRQSKKKAGERQYNAHFEAQDFDPTFDKDFDPIANCQKLLHGKIDDSIIEQLLHYQREAVVLRKKKRDPRKIVPTNFIFKGPSGTGKTITAQQMGKIYYYMGFLSSEEVIEISASDLIGKCVGHTAPKTKKQLEKALGKVLFIDHAYELGSGEYQREAVEEIQRFLEKHTGQIVVILAGDDFRMNKLLTSRAQLSSLFPDDIVFPNLGVRDCISLLGRELKSLDISEPAFITDHSNPGYELLQYGFRILQKASSSTWSNAREVKTLAKEIARLVIKRYLKDETSSDGLKVSLEEIKTCMISMASRKRGRSVKAAAACDLDSYGDLEPCSFPNVPAVSGALHQAADFVNPASHYGTESSAAVVSSSSNVDNCAAPTFGNFTPSAVENSRETAARAKEEVERKLRKLKMEACPNGYTWHKEGDGYRCEGGEHFVSPADLLGANTRS